MRVVVVAECTLKFYSMKRHKNTKNFYSYSILSAIGVPFLTIRVYKFRMIEILESQKQFLLLNKCLVEKMSRSNKIATFEVLSYPRWKYDAALPMPRFAVNVQGSNSKSIEFFKYLFNK